MNKYKEALHFFESYIGVTDSTVTNNLVEEYVDILNELIDKETPKKPNSLEAHYYTCQCCGSDDLVESGEKDGWYKVLANIAETVGNA